MHCPACSTVNLLMSERNGIEIDYCPSCRGVWLDRGELDKIIERTATSPAAPLSEANNRDRDHRMEQHPHQHHENGQYKKKKREGFFSDLFDFD
jgi:Zn-finger nucleic acid-binding protein